MLLRLSSGTCSKENGPTLLRNMSISLSSLTASVTSPLRTQITTFHGLSLVSSLTTSSGVDTSRGGRNIIVRNSVTSGLQRHGLIKSILVFFCRCPFRSARFRRSHLDGAHLLHPPVPYERKDWSEHYSNMVGKRRVSQHR